ncbi:MAG TPA: hypothetical protein VFQ20_05955 [Burkholderiaceae bacterium]|nr:hypothetical protein [Burkholderiaceae bacterium]
MRRPARGEVPVRLIVFGLVGIALLVAPLWFLKKERRAKLSHADAAERRADAPASAPPRAPASPDRFGLTWGWQPGSLHAGHAFLSCLGQPAPVDNPRHGACNVEAGDTSCRTVLPLLCARAGSPRALGTTRAVAGFTLGARADADALCAAELGAGWRMAASEDGGGAGGELNGVLDPASAAPTHQRVWVAVENRRANCWD